MLIKTTCFMCRLKWMEDSKATKTNNPGEFQWKRFQKLSANTHTNTITWFSAVVRRRWCAKWCCKVSTEQTSLHVWQKRLHRKTKETYTITSDVFQTKDETQGGCTLLCFALSHNNKWRYLFYELCIMKMYRPTRLCLLDGVCSIFPKGVVALVR